MDLATFTRLYQDHRWVPLIALLIGLVVRLLKSDTKIPIDIPSEYRKYLAFGLALVGGVVEKVATGVTWKDAIFDAAAAWFFAEWGHKIFIEDARGGKELALPGLIVPGAKPSPDKPITVPPGPPKPPTGPMMSLMVIFAFVLAGCIPAKDAKDVKDKSLSVIQIACVIANAFLPDSSLVMKSCNIAENFTPVVVDLMTGEKKAAAIRAAQGDKTSLAPPKPVCIKGDELVLCTP